MGVGDLLGGTTVVKGRWLGVRPLFQTHFPTGTVSSRTEDGACRSPFVEVWEKGSGERVSWEIVNQLRTDL